MWKVFKKRQLSNLPSIIILQSCGLVIMDRTGLQTQYRPTSSLETNVLALTD